MRKARHILAVMAVTTALCADQVAMAAPVQRPQVSEMAARLMDRLSQTFRRTVPNAVRPIDRSRLATVRLTPLLAPAPLAVSTRCELSPFQFRLPPPLS